MSRTAVFILGLLCSTFALAADRAMQPSYSAMMSMETSAGVMKGPVAAMPGKQRRVFDMQGQSVVNISRFDKGVAWMLMPDQKMYRETKLDTSGDDNGGALSDYQVEATEEGRETVNGVSAIKSKIVMTGKDGSKFGGFSWRTDDGVVVKFDAITKVEDRKERIKLDLTDLQVGPQDPALDGYIKDVHAIAAEQGDAVLAAEQKAFAARGGVNAAAGQGKNKLAVRYYDLAGLHDKAAALAEGTDAADAASEAKRSQEFQKGANDLEKELGL
jgi:hypothetical protein